MPATSVSCQALHTLSALRYFVHQQLCELNGLAADAHEMSEEWLLGPGRQCGLLFCVRGPRSVMLTAVWDADRNVILFYGSAGQRFHRMQLAEGPAQP